MYCAVYPFISPSRAPARRSPVRLLRAMTSLLTGQLYTVPCIQTKGNKAQHLLPNEMAVCAMTVELVPPCQCVSPPGICTISPTRKRCGSSPLLQMRPVPIVTVKIYNTTSVSGARFPSTTRRARHYLSPFVRMPERPRARREADIIAHAVVSAENGVLSKSVSKMNQSRLLQAGNLFEIWTFLF